MKREKQNKDCRNTDRENRYKTKTRGVAEGNKKINRSRRMFKSAVKEIFIV